MALRRIQKVYNFLGQILALRLIQKVYNFLGLIAVDTDRLWRWFLIFVAHVCEMAQLLAMADDLTLQFCGAAGTVTGSCMLFAHKGAKFLVDCGLFQGSRTLEKLNYQPFEFAPNEIDFVILTHAHIDHSGLLPKLVAEGFKGDIYCTAETKDLLQYMLADAGRIQESETNRRNRRLDRSDQPAIKPAYTEADGIKAYERAKPVDFDQWFSPFKDIKARLWNAGHILGSASIELEIGGVKIMCSGDIGPDNKAFLDDPEGAIDLDYVICESTYGNRVRKKITIEERRNLLETEIDAALSKGGNLVIPVFALERTQELLADIAYLNQNNRTQKASVFIDSPLASQATSVFAKYAAELRDLPSSDVFENGYFHFVEDVEVSKRINNVRGAIILSASGMCEAGRIRHHLIANLPRPQSTILFVGFQAQGSLGRTILDGAKRVRISGQDVAVRAQVCQIDSYSAHADGDELLNWILARRPINGNLFLTHGEAQSIKEFKEIINSADANLKIITPEIGEKYLLESHNQARRIKTGNLEITQNLRQDWQNLYADFSLNLKENLVKIPDPQLRRSAILDMNRILSKYVKP